LLSFRQHITRSNVLYSLLDFARAHPENEYIAAAVIGKDPSPFLHYIFLDQGSDAGVLHGMPVVTSQGLVGRVDAVTLGHRGYN
jgi:rod shape-determining protein MreC